MLTQISMIIGAASWASATVRSIRTLSRNSLPSKVAPTFSSPFFSSSKVTGSVSPTFQPRLSAVFVSTAIAPSSSVASEPSTTLRWKTLSTAPGVTDEAPR